MESMHIEAGDQVPSHASPPAHELAAIRGWPALYIACKVLRVLEDVPPKATVFLSLEHILAGRGPTLVHGLVQWVHGSRRRLEESGSGILNR